jgi:hypothetical protein
MCGKELVATNSLAGLLRHLHKRASIEQRQLQRFKKSLQGKPDDEWWQNRVQKQIRLAAKWQSWAEALEKQI